jgi:hypothetical protein
MLFDREPADYTVHDTILRVQGDDGTVNYPFGIDEANQTLTLTLPDGTKRTYDRDDAGEAEQQLNGTFYPSAASSSQNTIQFDGDHTFYFLTPKTETSGLYRVEGDVIVLTRGDSATDEAQVQSRDGDGGSVLALTYHGVNFESEVAIAAAQQPEDPVVPDYGSTVVDYAAPPMPPPPIDFLPPPPPPAVASVPSTSTSSAPAKTEKPAEKGSRDFGSTRDGKPGRR